MKKFFKVYFKSIFIGVMAALIIQMILNNFFVIAKIPSESMMNTLMVGDRVLVKTKVKSIKRGKIYTFSSGTEFMIKRAIAIGGDHLIVKGNDVYVNDEKIEEDYEYYGFNYEDESVNIDVIVPEDSVFFLGDNRLNSYDSRYWDEMFIKEEDIIGEAIRVILPLNRMSEL